MIVCFIIIYYRILYYSIWYDMIWYYIIFYYMVLYFIHYIILYYILLYYKILYYSILYYTILHYMILYYVILYYIILNTLIINYILCIYNILYIILSPEGFSWYLAGAWNEELLGPCSWPPDDFSFVVCIWLQFWRQPGALTWVELGKGKGAWKGAREGISLGFTEALTQNQHGFSNLKIGCTSL